MYSVAAVRGRSGSLTRLGMLAAAALCGWCLDLASPDTAIWPLGIFAAMGFSALLLAARPLFGALIGFVFALAFWLPHISWLTLYLGPVPWLALASVMVLWGTMFGALVPFLTRVTLRCYRSRGARIVVIALLLAGSWVLRELLQAAVPYGGFSWGRFAATQVNSPFIEAVSWLGIAGFTGVFLFLVLLPVSWAYLVFVVDPPLTRSFFAPACSLLGVLALALVPLCTTPKTGELTIAGVQGNSKSGIFDDRENGSVFADHLAASKTLLDGDGKQLDLIVWPENAAEFNIDESPLHRQRLVKLAEQTDAPILVGSVLADPVNGSDKPRYTNSALLFNTDGKTLLRYDKINPVPFAEYMPHREFYRALAPELVDLVALDYSHGQTPAVAEHRGTRLGIGICFDITFDRHAELLGSDNAEVILALTNNADFGKTDESAQQLALTKLQGIALGRSVVNISTVGMSQILDPSGHSLVAIPAHEAGTIVASVPIHTEKTAATQFGALLSALWCAAVCAPLINFRFYQVRFKQHNPKEKH